MASAPPLPYGAWRSPLSPAIVCSCHSGLGSPPVLYCCHFPFLWPGRSGVHRYPPCGPGLRSLLALVASRFCCCFVVFLVSVLAEGLVKPYNIVVAVALPVTLTVVVTDSFVEPGSPVCCAALIVCRKVLVYALVQVFIEPPPRSFLLFLTIKQGGRGGVLSPFYSLLHQTKKKCICYSDILRWNVLCLFPSHLLLQQAKHKFSLNRPHCTGPIQS